MELEAEIVEEDVDEAEVEVQTLTVLAIFDVVQDCVKQRLFHQRRPVPLEAWKV